MPKPVRISKAVSEKLRTKHNVSHAEVFEAFLNQYGPSFRDTREKHDTDPPSYWFMSMTDRNRPLKVVYVERDDAISIKTAFEPTDTSPAIYAALCKKHKH